MAWNVSGEMLELCNRNVVCGCWFGPAKPDQVSDMVGEERPPVLRLVGAPLRHQRGDGALGHVDAELQEFAMDSRSAPEGVGHGHPNLRFGQWFGGVTGASAWR
jgi:hypothetical protein